MTAERKDEVVRLITLGQGLPVPDNEDAETALLKFLKVQRHAPQPALCTSTC